MTLSELAELLTEAEHRRGSDVTALVHSSGGVIITYGGDLCRRYCRDDAELKQTLEGLSK